MIKPTAQQALEELRYDVAHAMVERTSVAGRFALAVDHMINTLANRTEEELLSMMGPQEKACMKDHFRKKKNKKGKPKGF